MIFVCWVCIVALFSLLVCISLVVCFGLFIGFDLVVGLIVSLLFWCVWFMFEFAVCVLRLVGLVKPGWCLALFDMLVYWILFVVFLFTLGLVLFECGVVADLYVIYFRLWAL